MVGTIERKLFRGVRWLCGAIAASVLIVASPGVAPACDDRMASCAQPKPGAEAAANNAPLVANTGAGAKKPAEASQRSTRSSRRYSKRYRFTRQGARGSRITWSRRAAPRRDTFSRKRSRAAAVETAEEPEGQTASAERPAGQAPDRKITVPSTADPKDDFVVHVRKSVTLPQPSAPVGADAQALVTAPAAGAPSLMPGVIAPTPQTGTSLWPAPQAQTQQPPTAPPAAANTAPAAQQQRTASAAPDLSGNVGFAGIGPRPAAAATADQNSEVTSLRMMFLVFAGVLALATVARLVFG